MDKELLTEQDFGKDASEVLRFVEGKQWGLSMDIVEDAKMSDYKWFTSHGICPGCRKEKAAPRRKYCFDCLAKRKDYRMAKYDKEKERKYNTRKAEIRRNKIKNGICAICSKNATNGIYCYEHSIYTKRQSMIRNEENKRKRHERGLIPEYRETNGLCCRCGNPLSKRAKIDNRKMCDTCYEKQCEILKKAREKSPQYIKNRNYKI